MTQQEQQQLSAIVERLRVVQSESPTKTTYVRGQTDSSISYKLLTILRDLEEVIGHDTKATPERESETTA